MDSDVVGRVCYKALGIGDVEEGVKRPFVFTTNRAGI